MLAEEGVEVSIPGRSAKKISAAIATLHGLVRAVEADVSNAEGTAKLIREAPETDILINNLGIYESKSFVDITDENW
jgi:NADP-dependent 3-hydroxy acid dehydrogenase YdfG